MKHRLLLLVLTFISITTFGQAWQDGGNGLQFRYVGGFREVRQLVKTPQPPFAITDSLTAKGIKQNSLATDGTGIKYPTVDAVNLALGINQSLVAYVDTAGNNTTAVLGNSRNPFLTVDAALDALPSIGGVIKIGVGTFASPSQNKIKSNVKFIGSGKPVTNSIITYISIGVKPNITSPTRLVGGTILNGVFQVIQKDGIEVHDLGVDSGLDYCNEYHEGVSQEGLIFAQYYDVAGGLPSQDGFHQLQTNSPPRTGIVVNNVIALCKDANATNHAMLIENVINAKITNVSTYFGIHGLVIKGIGCSIDGFDGHGHAENGLIIKSNDYAYSIGNSITNFYISSIGDFDGAGIRFVGQNGIPAAFNSISNGTIEHTKYGIINSDLGDGNKLDNINVYYTQGVGVGFTAAFANAAIANIDQRNGTYGISITTGDIGVKTTMLLSGCKTSENSIVGYDLHTVGDGAITIVNSDGTNFGAGSVIDGNIFGGFHEDGGITGSFKFDNSSPTDYLSSIDDNGKQRKSLVKVNSSGSLETPSNVLIKGSVSGLKFDNPGNFSVGGITSAINGTDYWIQGVGVGTAGSNDYNIYNFGGGGALGPTGIAASFKKATSELVVAGDVTAPRFLGNLTATIATVSTAPTNPTDVVRLTDLGTGFAQYTDNSHTSGSPLVINSGATATITNNAATTIAGQLPIGVTSFYDSGTSKITPQNDGDSYLINVRFTAVSSSNTGLADVGIDIGGAMNIVAQETISLRKGAGQAQKINIIFDVFSGSTFIANGGLIKLNSIDGNTSIYDISYKVTRTHKAK